MTQPPRAARWLLFLSVLAGSAAVVEAADDGVGANLDFHVGYFLPSGDWNAHRYAPVDIVAGDFTLGGELEFPLFGIHLGLFANYTRLDTSAWEDYARSQGEDLAATASMADFGARLKFYVARRSPDLVNLSLGFVGTSVKGNESYGGRTYDYDFLAGGGGLVAGAAYKRVVSPHLAFVVEARYILVLEGVKYADGEKRDIQGFPLTLGLNYLF